MNQDIPMSVKMGPKSFEAILDLDLGKPIDEKPLYDLCDFIDLRLDCADFRMMSVLRVMYSYTSSLSEEVIIKMKDTILGFKYWMDEPGKDSMCYWSENHQILFFTSAYLAGKLYPKEVFYNSIMTGSELQERFKPRILSWLKHRYEHGFIEWHSNTYYEEDVPPLTLLIDFGDDELSQKATIVLDLLLSDIAMHYYKGLFSVTSGRCYEDQKREPLKQDVLEMIEYLFGKRFHEKLDYSRISSNLYLCKKYKMPDILKDIALDNTEQVIKTSMGHDLKELLGFENEKGIETTRYLQWAMESFTNSETVKRSMQMFEDYHMVDNDFLKDMQILQPRIIRPILPLITKILNPVTNGVAIQKVNSYTYRTKDYILSTAQNHYPGAFGDQQHIWQATIDEKTSIFTTHPGAALFTDNARNFSPSYWVGNGILPHSVQEKNIHLSIYDLSPRKGYMEKSRQLFTHAHFPRDQFDVVNIVDGNHLFAKKGSVNVALLGRNKLEFSTEDPSDLIQKGKQTFWIFEISSDEPFEVFVERVQSKKIVFDGKTLVYDNMSLTYKGSFKLNRKIVDTTYKRLESVYGEFERKDQTITIKYNGKQLVLNFEMDKREELNT